MSRPCIFGDPYCPCNDGDACHYTTYTWDPATPYMKPPNVFYLAKIVAEELTDNGHPVTAPDERSLDGVERGRWLVCLQIANKLWNAVNIKQIPMIEPKVPCPYGDDLPVGLSYYLSHQADFCMHRGEGDNSRLFQAASYWVVERINGKS